MKRLAFISDVHADVHALRDALASIEQLGCDQVICGGDLVDYGVYAEAYVMPSECRARLAKHRAPLFVEGGTCSA